MFAEVSRILPSYHTRSPRVSPPSPTLGYGGPTLIPTGIEMACPVSELHHHSHTPRLAGQRSWHLAGQARTARATCTGRSRPRPVQRVRGCPAPGPQPEPGIITDLAEHGTVAADIRTCTLMISCARSLLVDFPAQSLAIPEFVRPLVFVSD